LRANSRDAAFVDNHLPELRISQHRDYAGGRMSILLRLSRLRRTDETKARRLLCVLLIRQCPLPSGPGGAQQWRGNSLLPNIKALTHDLRTTKSMRFDFGDGFVNVIGRHPEVLGFVPSNLTKEGPMLSRRSVLLAAVAASAAIAAPASAVGPQPFNDAAFAEAQKAGKPIFVAIHASWCPTCKAQAPILAELMVDSKFKDLLYFTIDFDSQKDLVRRFGARMQSTLISFKGATEQGRSVGDTNRQSIAALLNKVL
jgi:thioredoxin 1